MARNAMIRDQRRFERASREADDVVRVIHWTAERIAEDCDLEPHNVHVVVQKYRVLYQIDNSPLGLCYYGKYRDILTLARAEGEPLTKSHPEHHNKERPSRTPLPASPSPITPDRESRP